MNELMLKTKTMSSLEIAELVRSRHDVVKKSIDRLIADRAIVQPPMADEENFDAMGRSRITQVYSFSGEQGKLDSITVVAQLSPKFTAALVKRWYELESHYEKNVVKEISLPKDYLSALKALVESEEAKQLAQEQLQIAAPKVQYFDMVADVNNYMNATTVGQKFGMSATVLNKHLEALDVYNRSIKQGRVFQQWFIDKGLGVMKKTENGYNQSRFTNRGEQWVIEKLTGEGVI